MRDWGAKGRTNAIGAVLGKTLLTVSLFTTTINSLIFRYWVEKELLPILPLTSVIVMDNAAFHKNKDMQDLIENKGYILQYLPPYSPDLNPIEKKWAHAKAIRKKHNCSIDDLFKIHLL